MSRRISEELTRKEYFPSNTETKYQVFDSACQILFLSAVQSVFLQKRHLETVDLYEPPLDMFGTDAMGRWFMERDANEIVELIEKLAV
jgi:hypothetical protein